VGDGVMAEQWGERAEDEADDGDNPDGGMAAKMDRSH
jgi:hypothetical protein